MLGCFAVFFKVVRTFLGRLKKTLKHCNALIHIFLKQWKWTLTPGLYWGPLKKSVHFKVSSEHLYSVLGQYWVWGWDFKREYYVKLWVLDFNIKSPKFKARVNWNIIRMFCFQNNRNCLNCLTNLLSLNHKSKEARPYYLLHTGNNN